MHIQTDTQNQTQGKTQPDSQAGKDQSQNTPPSKAVQKRESGEHKTGYMSTQHKSEPRQPWGSVIYNLEVSYSLA